LFGGVIVKFDKLHQDLTSYEYVPVIGDLMASRWAYEALAVEQAKNNRFDRNFYLYDQRKSEAQFMVSFLIPRLLNKLEECNRNLGVDGDQQVLEANLALLYREVVKLGSQPDLFKFEQWERLNMNDFNESYAVDLEDWLTWASQKFKDVSRTTSRQRDEVVGNLTDSLGSVEVFGSRQEYPHDLLNEEELSELTDSLGNEALIRLKQDYHNERLIEQVTNSREVTNILEINGKLVQKGDPIYLIPESNFGRAHFYAPVKIIGNRSIDTLWFNILVIWIFSFILYLTLYYDMIRKVVRLIENVRLRKPDNSIR
jgi:hypothetical protein